MNFDFLFESFGTLLAYLYEIRNSYAFMIIGLTLVVMVVVTPLTLKATRSMLMMQQLQPEMKRLQSQYKDDRQRLNEELLKFYRENNINPMGSCLPLLVQTPVFLVLYNVLRGLAQRVPTMGSNVGHVVGQHLTGDAVTAPQHVVHPFDPQYLPGDSKLYENLHGATEMNSLGMDLARSAQEILSRNVFESIPYLVLIALVAVTAYTQQRQTQSRNKDAAINPQQQAILKIMPFFLPVFSFTLPAGLVLYFVVSNTYRVGQQWFISRNIYGKADLAKGGPETTGEAGGVTGFLDRLMGREATTAEKPPAGASTAKAPVGKSAADSKARAEKASPKTAGGQGRPAAKGGRVTSKSPPAKAGSKAASPAARNGRSRGADAGSKEKAGTRTSKAPGSSGRPSSARRKASSSEPRQSTDRPPTLQPRARKNKKR